MDTFNTLGELGMGSRLKRLSEMCMKAIKEAYTACGIDFDPYLFPAYHKIAKDKKTTNSAISEALHTSQPAVTQTLNKLSKKELIVLEADPDDGRKKQVSLSKKGVELFAQVQPVWAAMDAAVKKFTSSPADTMIDHIIQFETAIRNGTFLDTIVDHVKAPKTIQIVSFDPKYGQAFYDLNAEWLETYFYVEEFDHEVLSNPDTYILDKGGQIFFAVEDGEAVGTVALMKLDNGDMELTKMAVRPDQRGKKIGQQLMDHCVAYAKGLGLDKIILYSNTKLENAIYIYRKYGFVEIEQELDSHYERSNIKMELVF